MSPLQIVWDVSSNKELALFKLRLMILNPQSFGTRPRIFRQSLTQHISIVCGASGELWLLWSHTSWISFGLLAWMPQWEKKHENNNHGCQFYHHHSRYFFPNTLESKFPRYVMWPRICLCLWPSLITRNRWSLPCLATLCFKQLATTKPAPQQCNDSHQRNYQPQNATNCNGQIHHF